MADIGKQPAKPLSQTDKIIDIDNNHRKNLERLIGS